MKSKYPRWVLKYRRKGTAIHKIGENYYLYEITSKWDKGLKRARKITKGYLGAITKEGLQEPGYRINYPTSCKEYGASRFLINENGEILDRLKEYFPDWWKEIFILSVFRLMYRAPLKHMPLYYQDSWISEEIKTVSLSKENFHKLLSNIGGDRERIARFLREFICRDEKLLIDFTHVFSLSNEVTLAEKGYNSELDFTPQINLLYIFSADKKMPLFYRVLPGNVRDISSLKATIEESRMKDVIIIGDKGFYSEGNIKLLEGAGLQYVLPLRRNNKWINYKVLDRGKRREFEGYLKFNKRYIWYYRCDKTIPIWVFLDEELKAREENDYLARIETHPEFGYSIENFYQKSHTFGTVALITNLTQISAKKVFEYFKSRNGIEQMFDTFKNTLEADRTYMRSDKAIESWMFINYLSLVYYYKIYHLLVEKALLSRYSVLDVLLYLSKYRKVRVSTHWLGLEIPKQTKRLIEKLNIPIT